MRSFLLMLLWGMPAVVCAQPPSAPEPHVAVISGVAVTPGPVVAIAATGPLPSPRVGVLHDPDRIYVDLAGVSTRTVKTAGDGAVVTTVRAAQHGIDPLVARIVIDLAQPCSYAVNALQQVEGHLEISLTPKVPGTGPAAAPARPPTPAALPAAPPPPPRQSSSDPATRRYLGKLKPALDGVETLRRVLEDIDQGHQVSPDRLASARVELDHLQAALGSVTPPRKFEDVDGLLKSVGTFASNALDLASRSTGDVPKNASSAAAGALMMLDRAVAQLDQNNSAKDQFAALSGHW